MINLTQGNIEEYDANSLVLKATINDWDTDSPGRGYFVFPNQRLSDKILSFKRSTQKLFFPYFSTEATNRALVIDNVIFVLTAGTIPIGFEVEKVFIKLCYEDMFEMTHYSRNEDVDEWIVLQFTGKVILYEPG